MPRTTSSHITSAFSRVQKQVRELLAGVRREIRSKEADLRRLKKEESQLSAITGQRGGPRSQIGFRWIFRCDGPHQLGHGARTAAEAVQGIPNPHHARAQEQAVL
jgi:hypothetical protein